MTRRASKFEGNALTGFRSGRLVGIALQRRDPGGYVWWHALCDCGTVIVVRADNLSRRHRISCGCAHQERTPDEFKRRLKLMRAKALMRGVEWTLPDRFALAAIKTGCYYCGGTNPGKPYNGIDRLDPDKGYTIDNCVPCCIMCNRAKMAMPLEEFLEWAERLCDCNNGRQK